MSERSRPDPEKGSHKLVTVIFAKITGFKPETGSHDELEELSLRKSEMDAELDRIVSKYGGVVDKIIREFFMATFGTRISHAEAPARAVLAAMEIVECAKKFGVEAHVGINTGMAWVGAIGTELDTDLTVIGEAVNLAARLKDQAGPNQIVVSRPTYERTRDLFLFKPLPPVKVKGISRPVEIYEVVGRTEKSELIAALSEDEEERLARIQESIPSYLRDKILSSKSRVEGERKLVTMLYSDLSGFTALSERFKDRPDIIAAVIDRCHKELGRIIYKWEGVVDKLVGDEIMAIFGAPVIHEDDPERAIMAGLEMLERMKSLSRELSEEFGTPPLNIHIGINTGRVSIGNISLEGGLRMDYTVIGEPVELAEKLEEISEPGQIVVGESTYRLTRASFDFKPLGEVEVGGRRVRIYEVLGRKAVPEPKRGVKELRRPPLIGRDEELKALLNAAEETLEGRRTIVCIIGQAGLGKSRLKAEFKERVANRMEWLESSCLPHTQKLSYSLFAPLFRRYFGIDEADPPQTAFRKIKHKLERLFESRPEAIDEISPFMAHMLSIRSEEVDRKLAFLEPQQVRDRIFISVRETLSAHAAKRPLILALDDLHWIDPLSLDLIHFLIQTLPEDLPLMLICIYRPERTDPCWSIGEMASKMEGYVEVTLGKLSREESRRLLEALIDLEDAEELKELILDRSDGNPFYMEEILRSLIDDGVLVEREGRWRVEGEVAEIRVPDSLEQVIGARIDKLEDDPKYVLQKSSVIGRRFEYPILKRVAEVERLEEHLNKLCALDMIKPVDEVSFAFEHILTYEIAYNTITAPRRRRYHGEVGDCIEGLYRDVLERFYGILAHHYSRSDNDVKAVIYLTLAGHQARMLYDNQTAKALYQMGLARFDRLPAEKAEELERYRGEIYEGLGDVCQMLGEYDDALQFYRKRLERLSSPAARASVRRRMGLVYDKKGEWEEALRQFESALKELEGEPDPVEEARIYNAMGMIHFRRADYPRAIELISRAIELAEDRGAYDVLSNSYRYLGNCYYYLGDIGRAKELYQKGLEIARRLGDALQLSYYYNNLGAIHRREGDLDRAIEYYLKSYEEKEKIGYADGMIVSLQNIATIYSDKGDSENAERFIDKARRIAERIGAQKRIADIYASLGTSAFYAGRYDQSIENYRKALEIFERIGDKLGVGLCYANMSDAYTASNRLEEAQRYSEMALRIAQELGQPELLCQIYDNLGNIRWKMGRFEEAMGYYEKALEAVGEGSVHALKIRRHMAQTLVCMGRIGEAVRAFREIEGICRRQGRRRELEEITESIRVLESAGVEEIPPDTCFGELTGFKMPKCRDECLKAAGRGR